MQAESKLIRIFYTRLKKGESPAERIVCGRCAEEPPLARQRCALLERRGELRERPGAVAANVDEQHAPAALQL